MKSEKKILAITATLAIVMTMIPSVTFAGTGVVTADDLVAAVENASEGDTIVLGADITVSELDSLDAKGKNNTFVTIKNGQKITIDLNGHVLDVASNKAVNTNVIANNGSLTIKDSSTAKTGKITFKYSGASCNYGGWGTYTITNGNGSTFVLDGGIIENTTSVSNHIFYAINNITYGDAVTNVTINGGDVINKNYTAIRNFENSSTGKVVLTLNDGTIMGTTGIYIQNPSASVHSKGVINVNGGSVKSTRSEKQAIYVYGYGLENIDGISININGGMLDGYIHVYPESTDKEVVTAGDTFKIEKAVLTYDGGTESFYYTLTCIHKNITVIGAIEAACVEDGYTGDSYCDNCDALVKEGTVVEATGKHVYENGVCTICGGKEPAAPTAPADKLDEDSPKTGDTSDMTVPFALVALAAAAMAAAAGTRRKHSHK